MYIDEETYEYLTNHYFRAGHDGCDEYTNLTTFHGMVNKFDICVSSFFIFFIFPLIQIRVFNSRNCPSLIFWCLVVTTCLVFYIMVVSDPIYDEF